MADWYDKAIKSQGNDAGSFATGYQKKGVLHTTEGTSAAGAIGAYKKHNSWPHFTVDPAGKVYQHVGINRAARSLQNLSGGVETNRGGAIQIEVVGYASKPNWPVAQANAMRALMRWVEAQTGIRQIGPKFGSSEQYGLKNPFELTGAQWIVFNGWCGHQHIPENSHWDPGAIELPTLFSAPSPTPTPVPVGFTVPSSYYTEVSIVPFTISRSQGGYAVVGQDGGVFTYDVPFHGSLGGVALSSPIVDATWTPTGNGYWLMSADGAVFGFGDAQYKGGFNALEPGVRGDRKPIGIVASGAGYTIVTLDPSQDGSPFDGYSFQ